jgi:hypothetical protein
MSSYVSDMQWESFRAKSVARSALCLPRLLYIGDVPVEASYHGSALLYRLLQRYPADRVRVIENIYRSLPARRLPGVIYRSINVRAERLLRTRFHKWISAVLSLSAPWWCDRIERHLDGFQPEAVLSVAHGFSWMTAAAFASRHGLPLHFIVHDDWPAIVTGARPVRAWVDREVRRCYLKATSRLCVSSYMLDEYKRRYGVNGTILYPCRAADAVLFDLPPERLRHTNPGITAAFAGTINDPGDAQTLQRLAGILNVHGGRLLIYGPLTREVSATIGLDRQNIDVRGLVSSSDLIQRVRDEADILFVPMSFHPECRARIETNFPSKLTDYTAMGLPLLIYGPDYSSAVRWATENPGVAEVVTADRGDELSAAIERLRAPDHRLVLAKAALLKGKTLFSHSAAERVFFTSLTKNASGTPDS